MAIIVVNIIPRKQVENSQTSQYTVVSGKTIIDKFTVTNNSSSSATFNCNLPASGDSATDSNKVLNNRIIIPGETYACPELVGQILEIGGSISTIASAASALTISASGREITS